MFIAEKGLDIETTEIDLANGEQLGPAFKAINPRCTVPALALSDGTVLTENAGIAAFLESYQPEPALLGVTAVEKGLIANWNARVELEGLIAVADAFRNQSKGLKDRAITGPRNFAQIPELAERGRQRAEDFLDMLDEQLGKSPYIAGDAFSVADITALCVVDFAAWIKITPSPAQTNLKRWHESLSTRPSSRL